MSAVKLAGVYLFTVCGSSGFLNTAVKGNPLAGDRFDDYSIHEPTPSFGVITSGGTDYALYPYLLNPNHHFIHGRTDIRSNQLDVSSA
jgi:hypothetical protein